MSLREKFEALRQFVQPFSVSMDVDGGTESPGASLSTTPNVGE